MQDPANSQPTKEELEAREAGPGRVPTPIVGELPAGGATWPGPPHFAGKVGLVNQVSRAYRWTHDEALRHSRSNAVATLRDLIVRNALSTRWTPTVQLSWHLQAKDETDPAQTAGVEKLTKVIERTPRLQDFFLSLLWGEYFGRQGVAQLFEWVPVHTEQWMVVRNHRPINGDSLVPRWSGDWGVLVNGTWEGEKEVTDRGFAHYFTPSEREAVVIHTAPPEDCDYFEPELAGQIQGSGLRGHIYWKWFLKSNFEALLADYGERFANGIWIGWYEESNPESKTQLEAALAGYHTKRHILFPRTATGETPYGLDIKDVGAATPQFLLELIQEANDLIHAYLTGRSLQETDEQVGGDGAGLVEDRISRVVKYSATRLANTLSTDWLPVLSRYNTPGVEPPYFRFDIETPNAGETLGFAKTLHDLGGDIDLDHLFDICGLPTPSPGDAVASKIQPLSPMATQTPQGVPVSGQPVPDQGQTQPPTPPPPATPPTSVPPAPPVG